jgi:diphthine-ammonia ligase
MGRKEIIVNTSRNYAFCSWSGGKESVLSLFRAIRSGVNVVRLVNMMTEDGAHSRTHGITAELIQLQAKALGIPLIQRPASWDTYEEEFKTVLRMMTGQGIGCGIFGDIDLEEHRAWVVRVASECSITPSLPLWCEQRDDLLAEFIRSGFKAVMVAVDKRYLDETWIGREIDDAFVGDIRTQNVDICGEAGEYHTFVYDGPIFKEPVIFGRGGVRSDGDHFFLDIIDPSLKGGS